MGKQKYFLEYQGKIQRNIGRDDIDTNLKIVDAFNDAMDIIASVTEMESLKTTVTVQLTEGIYEYELSEFDMDDVKHIYTIKLNDGTRYYDPLRYVTQNVWDNEVAPYIHTASGRPTMFTLFDDVFQFASVPDSADYTLDVRFLYWPAKVDSILSEVDVCDFDTALISMSTAFVWLKLEEVELYREWMTKAGQENKIFRLDSGKVIDFMGKSNTRRQVSVGPDYWSDPFRRSAP